MKKLLLSLVVAPALALAAPRKPVIAFMPANSNVPDLANLGLLMEARASELLEATGKYSELHIKQVHAMADGEGLDRKTLSDAKVAEQARVLLGADRVVTMNLNVQEDDDTKMVISGQILDGKKSVDFKTSVAATWPEALAQGSETIAKAMLGLDKGALPKKFIGQPESKNQEALLKVGECYSTVIRQPMGVEAPVTLVGEEIDLAAAACQRALDLDASLRFATATMALAQAIVGDDAEAAKTLATLTDAEDMLEPYTLARFWLLTRYQSNEAGIGFLKDIIKKHPNELLPRAYLAEALASMNEHQKAVDAWKDYLALAPATPYAQGRMSRALARAGKLDDSIASAKKALEMAPTSKDARLQLASRQIDASKLDDAIATLKPLTDAADVKGEQLLRLGWAYWLKGDVDTAAKHIQSAIDKAKSATEWRTRGRALYNLAMVEAKRGKNDAAKKAYKDALDTGFRVATVDPVLAGAVKGMDAPTVKPSGSTKESSLFPADAAGDIDPAAKKPAAPAGLTPYGKK